MQSQSQTEGQYQAVWQTHQVNWRRKFLDPVGVVAALECNVWVYVLELQQLENEDHYRIFRFSALSSKPSMWLKEYCFFTFYELNYKP